MVGISLGTQSWSDHNPGLEAYRMWLEETGMVESSASSGGLGSSTNHSCDHSYLISLN